MTIRVGKLNGKNLNYLDHDVSSLDYALINQGVIEWMNVTTGFVEVGRALIAVTRKNVTPHQKFFVHVEVTTKEPVDTTGTKKVWIEVNKQFVENGTLATNPNGTGIARIMTGSSYPNANEIFFLPLASIVGGNVTDERAILTMKNIARKWYTSDGILSVENGEEKVLTNLPQGMVDGIKNPVKREILNEIFKFHAWVMREAVPNSQTGVVFLKGWKHTMTIQQYTRRFDFSFPFHFTLKKIKLPNTNNGSFDVGVTPYSDTNQALAKQRISINYSSKESNELSIRTKRVIIEYNGSSDTDIIVEMELQLEEWFYLFRHNWLFWRLVGFLQNKRVWERIHMADISSRNTIPFTASNGKYGIKNDGLVGMIQNDWSWYLEIWEVFNNTLFIHLNNRGTFKSPTYIFHGTKKEKERDIRVGYTDYAIHSYWLVTNSIDSWTFI